MRRPQAGDRIHNYLLDDRIGAGSFGEVWKAHHHFYRDDVAAIKIPTDPQYVRQLQDQGALVHGWRHENVVRSIDLDPYGDVPYLVMEYVDGPSLQELLAAHSNGLELRDAIAVLHGVLGALQAAHREGVVHGDLKPANILIEYGARAEGLDPAQVRVTDFGHGPQTEAQAESIVQSASLENEQGRRAAVTLAYMAPEQRDRGSVDPRSDLYSAGVVLHEMTTGRLPQGSDPLRALREDVPPWLDDVYGRMYARIERRFETAGEIRERIHEHWPASRGWGRGTGEAVRAARGSGDSDSAGDKTRCGRCGGRVESDHRFCVHCGQQLAEHTRRCPSCHAFASSRDNYCILCGADLRKHAC
jgi:serine/threonine protein kinase